MMTVLTAERLFTSTGILSAPILVIDDGRVVTRSTGLEGTGQVL
jgi:hypothetical protein